jgi:alkylation response protein AidB-like acyl-CoA dehydrogenase
MDLDAPGVTVEPLVALNGVRLWNQVFFDDVRVPAENLLGAENEGWTVAKRLLEDERVMVSRVAENYRLLGNLKEAAGQERLGGGRLINDPTYAEKIAQLELRLTALENLSLRLLSSVDKGVKLGAEPSMLKLLGSELVQATDTATIEAIAYYGVPDYRDGLQGGDNNAAIGPEHAAMTMSGYLHHRGFTIAGGSSEIQHGIIAKQLLGL